MDKQIDARGIACPGPVLKTREALNGAEGPFTVLVDNETACENVSRFARTSGCGVEVAPLEGGFTIRVQPGLASEACEPGTAASSQRNGGTVLFIGTEEIGKGDRELGVNLMKTFLYTCAESGNPPVALVFMNSGVRLVTENDETAAHVRRLEEGGSDVVVCGTCLDYYGLKEKLQAGRVGNMYEIQSMLVGAGLVVSV